MLVTVTQDAVIHSSRHRCYTSHSQLCYATTALAAFIGVIVENGQSVFQLLLAAAALVSYLSPIAHIISLIPYAISNIPYTAV
jgi:hypothetical protein